MEYELTTNTNGLPLLIVNKTIFFSWDDSDDYIVFRQALQIKGVKLFAELLAADPNTAFTIFCNGL